MSTLPRAFAVVPAAGVGRRMGGPIPKQYLHLHSRLVIEHTLDCLLAHPRIQIVVVAISAEDGWWAETDCAIDPRVHKAKGGVERCHSVLNALTALDGLAKDGDWVLVHDAVRPCLRKEDLNQLFKVLESHPVGGLLATPTRDTMKRAATDSTVSATVPRDNLWHAHTPQMFRLGLLRNALTSAINQQRLVTDEAEAMELAGHAPLLVEGRMDNIKITRPEDLALAEFFLATRVR